MHVRSFGNVVVRFLFLVLLYTVYVVWWAVVVPARCCRWLLLLRLFFSLSSLNLFTTSTRWSIEELETTHNSFIYIKVCFGWFPQHNFVPVALAIVLIAIIVYTQTQFLPQLDSLLTVFVFCCCCCCCCALLPHRFELVLFSESTQFVAVKRTCRSVGG